MKTITEPSSVKTKVCYSAITIITKPWKVCLW